MKHFLFALLVACAAVPAAATPQTDAAVAELMAAMDTRTMIVASFSEMEKALPAMMRAQVVAEVNADANASQASRDAALARIDRFLPHAAEAMNRLLRDPTLIDEMMAEIGPLYARHYTVAELKELAAFYRTPLGRKMLALSPRLGAESMAIGQKVVAPRLGAMLTDVMQSAQVK